MAEVFARDMVGVVTGYEIVDPVTDPETGELLAGTPVHMVKLEGPDGFGATMRVELTVDRRFAQAPVGKPVRVRLEMPRG